MKAILVSYDKEERTVTIEEGTGEEDWEAVCERFDNDVQRIKTVKGQKEFTALFECFDADNRSFHYLVEENARLHRLKRRHFLKSLGKKV